MNTKTPRSSEAEGRLTRRKQAKREALFAEAAQQLNDRGAGSVVLSEIGAAVGLSRNALYYYVADRTDLVFQSYVRSCELTASDLEAAARQGAAIPAITAFVEATMAFDRPPAAVLCDVDALDDERRAEIHALQARNTDALRALFRLGVEEGVFRPHDDEVAAQSLAGMMSWILLTPGWTNRPDLPEGRAIAVRTICSMVFDGMAADGQTLSPRPIDINALLSRPFDAFDRRQSGEIKMQQLAAAASRLFNRKGIDGVSLDEVGLEVGATKSVIYHYFKDKTDLVAYCYRRSLDLHETIQTTCHGLPDASAADRIATLIDLSCQAQIGPLSPLMMQAGFLNLPEADRTETAARITGFRKIWVGLCESGVAAGDCRNMDAVYSGVAATGLFSWLPKWRRADHRLSPTALSTELVSLVMLGLRRRE
jgi:AcrR family transcriptional regulator